MAVSLCGFFVFVPPHNGNCVEGKRGCKQEQSKSRDLEYRSACLGVKKPTPNNHSYNRLSVAKIKVRTLRLAFAGPDWNLKLRKLQICFHLGGRGVWKPLHLAPGKGPTILMITHQLIWFSS
ncbi:hypothetical protein CsSME_00032749 [Camellia sinensis var. sinensis]